MQNRLCTRRLSWMRWVKCSSKLKQQQFRSSQKPHHSHESACQFFFECLSFWHAPIKALARSWRSTSRSYMPTRIKGAPRTKDASSWNLSWRPRNRDGKNCKPRPSTMNLNSSGLQFLRSGKLWSQSKAALCTPFNRELLSHYGSLQSPQISERWRLG